jgi:hypothetical protein
MSFFDDLPAVGSTLLSGSGDEQYCVFAWLFNAGSGTVCLELKNNVDWDVGGTYLAKGIRWSAGAYGLSKSPAPTLTVPFTIVVGLNIDNQVNGSPFIASSDGVVAGLNQTGAFAFAWCANGGTYIDGSTNAGPVSEGVDAIVALHVHSAGYNFPGIMLGESTYGGRTFGDFAFIYIFQGEPDPATLVARIAADPYSIINLPVPASDWTNVPDWRDVEVDASAYPGGLARVKCEVWADAVQLVAVKARLWCVTTAASCGESAEATSDDPVTVDFDVTLVPGINVYRLQLGAVPSYVDLYGIGSGLMRRRN